MTRISKLVGWAALGGVVVLGAPPSLAAAVDPASFDTRGLEDAQSVRGLFRGELETVAFDREDVVFAVLFQQYLDAYARKCANELPANRVEMTERKCRQEQVTTNGFGVEISRICVEWVDVGTDLYAKPNLYAAMKEIDRLMEADRARQNWRLIFATTQSNSLGEMQGMVADARRAQSDMQTLVRNHSCSDPELLRFEENLRLFALHEEVFRLDGSRGVSQDVARAWSAFTEEDYEDLIDDLVADQSRGWALNRYMRGGVSDVTVTAEGGDPSRVTASYVYNGFNGVSRGSVELTFEFGRPECLEFWDARGMCRTPSRQIVARHVARILERGKRPRDSADQPDVATTPTAEAQSASPERVARPPVGQAVPPAEELHPDLRLGTDKPEPSEPPPPRRVLTAVSYVQGIKDACLEVLAEGERREPETTYCFCLSASVGTVGVPEEDVRWFFENFSEIAVVEMENLHSELVRPFTFCRAQRDAISQE